MSDQLSHRLLALFEHLSDLDRVALLRFAEFLAQQQPGSVPLVEAVEQAPVEIPEPSDIPRPEQEKVVEAIRRLSNTYFMLDKKSMLGATSDLVTQHILQGRDAAQVIDELEGIFRDSYRRLKEGES